VSERESEKSANTMASRVIFVVLFSDKLLQSSLVSIEAYLRPRCVTRVLFVVTRW